MSEALLETKDLTKVYGSAKQKKGQVIALQHFDLLMPISPAGIVTIAGESGSGKTTLANLILGFLPLTSGAIQYKGRDVSHLDKNEKLKYRREVQAVFQDPYSVYNPFYTVRHIFDITLRNFRLCNGKKEERRLVEEALNLVNLEGEDILNKYPHQLSGGQLQRIMIARAYMLKPSLIVADEPVSMIDVSLRAMILEIMMKLRDEYGISFIYITHDFSTAYQIGNEMYILYRGQTVEKGDTVKIVNNPQHPYTKRLIASIPTVDKKWEGDIQATEEHETVQNDPDSAPVFTEVEPSHWVLLP